VSYCTVEEVLDRMGHSGATTEAFMSRIEDAIKSATLQIDGDTGRVFTSTTATRTFRSENYYTRELYLPDFTAITTLKIDDDDDGVYETTIAATGYELDMMSDRVGWPFDTVRLVDRWYPTGGRRQRRVQIAGTWGWAAVPAPINQACSLMASRIAQRVTEALFGTQTFNDLGAASIRSNDPDYLRLIGPYSRPAVA
jgi:hypothetical protein